MKSRMRKLNNFITMQLCALCASVAMFWLSRLGTWVGSLTTQRTDLYFTLGYVGAWAVAVFVYLAVIIQFKEQA